MSRISRKFGWIIGFLALATFLISMGCGGEEDSPNQPPGSTNSLEIDPSPDSINAPWTIAGPDSYAHSGTGDAVLTDLDPGEYWVVWGAVEGWFTPAQASQTLDETGTVTFEGTYVFIGSGNVTVDVEPAEVTADWTLTGPDSYSLVGSGDQTIEDLIPGSYTLTWGRQTGWIRPEAENLALVADATITFTGMYTANQGTGTITLNPLPEHLSAPWSLRGPEGYVYDSTGTETVTDLTAGEYTVIWETLSGWVTPEASHELLLADGSLNLTVTYFEDDSIPGFQLLPPAMVTMPVGFLMGDKDTPDEMPHVVTLTHRFYMGEYEVTNGQYVELLQWAYNNFYVVATPSVVADNLDTGTSPLVDLEDEDCQIDFNGGVFTTPYPDRPMIDVSWYGAAAYCDWLNLREGLPRAYNHYNWRCNNFDPYGAEGYRLPTEAEWELSCRAGTTTKFNTGDCLDADTEANFNGLYPYEACPEGASLGRTRDVGYYPPNAWGLYDMHGNVFEWCNDRVADYGGSETDPIGPLTGSNRIIRGGGFSFEGVYCRSGARSNSAENYYAVGTGFRVARSAN